MKKLRARDIKVSEQDCASRDRRESIYINYRSRREDSRRAISYIA